MNANPTHISWRTGLRMTRPGFLVITVVACLMGLASAATGGSIDAVRAVATVLLAVIAHASANVLNDYHDALNGADAANSGGLFPFTGGARMIQNGDVSVLDTRFLAQALALFVVPAGLVLAAGSGSGLIAIGAAGMLIGWAYSAPPLALMSRGLGESAVAAAWWLIVIGADYVERGAFSPLPALAAAGYALLVANILLINGFPDAAADASVGKRTLAVKLGPDAAALLYLCLGLLAHGWLLAAVALNLLPGPVLWGLLSLPLSVAAALQLFRHRNEPDRLRPAIVLTIGAAVVHGSALAAGLAALA
jgi:1,4-dihydroxy-2-naphthoate octaprenyltransferase